MNKKNKVSIILNSIIIVLELVALTITFSKYIFKQDVWYIPFEYYTNLSNIMLLVSSILVLSPKKCLKFRYTSIVCTFLTFFCVLFATIITWDFSYTLSVEGNMFLFLHTICPILGFVSFMFFEKSDTLKIIDLLFPTIFSILYATMLSILYFNGIELPYMSYFAKQGLDIDVYLLISRAFIGIGLSAIIAFLIIIIKNKMKEENNG